MSDNKLTVRCRTCRLDLMPRIKSIWGGMVARCTDPDCADYPRYGGVGIGICQEWLQFEVFLGWSLAHGYCGDFSIDRIDGKGSYSPDNCRWADRWQQAHNIHWNDNITAWGETKCLSEWVRDPRCLISRRAYKYRLTRGLSPEEALSSPSWPHRQLTSDRAPKTGIQRNNINVTAFGETKNLTAWSKDPRCKVNRYTIQNRLNVGMNPEKAISMPALRGRQRPPQFLGESHQP